MKQSKTPVIPNCIFVSVWDGGSHEVRSEAHYNFETGEVTVLRSYPGQGTNLDREFIEFGEDEIAVCKTCHEFTTKPAMLANPHGPDLREGTQCRNPDCA